MKWRWKYTIAWIIWILAFLFIEGFALIDKGADDTLTEHVVWWIGESLIRKGVVAAFIIWLLYHFMTFKRRSAKTVQTTLIAVHEQSNHECVARSEGRTCCVDRIAGKVSDVQ